eukprot:TRINITY_DN563_c0_g1_i25.p1 TRINITY_DN563_c0_g1~~TRINITY_DN563_c0_g1_i25.p1  ORF type:complete len:128 (+),score=34.42 TRINITY_DN563_c0_g1_i25:646-1029(+)
MKIKKKKEMSALLHVNVLRARRGEGVLGDVGCRIRRISYQKGVRPNRLLDEDLGGLPGEAVVAGDVLTAEVAELGGHVVDLSLIHISEPTRLLSISYAVFCLKKKKKKKNKFEIELKKKKNNKKKKI